MLDFDLHIGWFLFGGAALLSSTVLPRYFSTRPLSLPILYVLSGFVAFSVLPTLGGPRPLASDGDAVLVEYGTELIVIVSLAGAGLKLDRKMGLVSWGAVWRLLTVGMVLTVLAAIALGFFPLGLGLGAAVLLGAVLAPTDPVLADDVQVESPGVHADDEVRFTLTAEAGLNDALAFPITYLAIAIGATGSFTAVAAEWITVDVAYRLVVGAGCGWALGRFVAWFARRSGEYEAADADRSTNEGLFVLGATIMVYGVTEVVNGYGFLAVFVAALTRDGHEYRERVSEFADQLERMLLAFVLLAFGALLAQGILDGSTWTETLVGVALVVVVRPICAGIAMIGSPLPVAERGAIAFFGIRGMGSLYYLAYATNQGDFGGSELASVWRVTTIAIITSIVLHGVTASPVMRWVDARCRR